MIQVPIDPYWKHAAEWWIENNRGNIRDFHVWLGDQGVLGLPRKEFTPYLEFDTDYEAVIFRTKWA
jgi:hypothetical protein